MNRTQSIISFAAVVFVYLCSHAGIVVDESMTVQVFTAIVGLAATIWGCFWNHNLTDAALWAQRQLNEFRQIKDRKGL